MAVWVHTLKGNFCAFQLRFKIENRKKQLFFQFSIFNFYLKIEKQNLQF